MFTYCSQIMMEAMKKWCRYDLQTFIDGRGGLSVLESTSDFKLRRVYYLYDGDPKLPRGAHAHKKLNQIMVAVSGSCKIKLDDGKTTEEFELNKPNQGLKVGSLVWRDIQMLSKPSVLMVFADQCYDEADYIRNYEEFKNTVKVFNDSIS
jgi:dTDP-4-dehydrorhamnose 3,5-epimerase-like enzyme